MNNYIMKGGLSPSKNNTNSSAFHEIVNLIAHKTNFAPRTYGKGYKMRCPAHEDKSPSLGISEGSDGKVLLHCYVGCSLQSICDAIGITVRDLFPQQNKLNGFVCKKRGARRNGSSRRSRWN
jgi:hypothetical protein